MMELNYRLLAVGDYWPEDSGSLAAAIASQGPFHPQVAIQGDTLTVRDVGAGLETHVRLGAYPAGTEEALLAGGYQAHWLDRDRDTPPLRGDLAITTTGPAEGGPETLALFHATVTDGLWWLMGGILADPYRHTLWGWRRWRTDQPLAAHAAATTARLATSPAGGTTS